MIVRRLTVAGFVVDPDWHASQDGLLPDGAGDPSRAAFQVPNLPGRPAGGFAVQAVGVDAAGKPVDPAAGTITLDVLEVTRYSADYDGNTAHVSAVEDPAAPLTPLAGMVLPANLVQRVKTGDAGGAQRQFALRVAALSAPAGAAEVRLLVAPLGGA
ncbi:MAG: hypothetical protein CL819_01320 [Croceicoccus sp.]|nr:hypothetical protein [Croceicoccus sp.]